MEQHRCYGCMELITEEVCPHCGYSVHQNNDPNQLSVGTLLRDQYLVGRVLGQGGFGITYMGWDTYLDEPVAIKEFYPTTAVNRDVSVSQNVRVNVSSAEQLYSNSRERFLREAKTLAKLRKIPEIVGIMGFFPANNTAYIIMEYVQGIDLRHFVRQKGGKLPAEELLRILDPVARALDAVHQAGLVHRDISPDNIMLKPDGTPKLLDFGAVRDAGSADADIDLSHSTEAILKHGFAPVEQYRARGNLGPWTDEYGFCASVYYCLTGQVPPDALTRMTDDIHPDWASVPGLTQQQRSALEKGMSIRAKDRFGSMKALYDALYGAAEPVPMTVPLSAAQPAVSTGAPKQAPVSHPEPKPAPKKKRRSILTPLLCIFAVFLIFYSLRVLQTGDTNLFPEDLTSSVTLPDIGLSDIFETEPWEGNVLIRDPFSNFGIDRTQIRTVTFRDTPADAPEDALDVSADGSRSVLAWVTGSNDVVIASEGGVNAEKDTCVGLFEGCTSLTTVTFGSGFHTEQATSMERMFANCPQLHTVDVENLDTSNVTSMALMFNMDVPNTDASGFTTYSTPYYTALHALDVSSWDVSKVTDMNGLFSCCLSLQELDVSSWDVSRVTDMTEMFYACKQLKTLDVSLWDVSNVQSTWAMFCHCQALQALDVSRWNVSNVTNMGSMFCDCSWLYEPDVSNWDVSNVENYEDFMSYGRTLGGQPWKQLFED